MDLGDFLVTGYISIPPPRLPPAYPLGIARVFFTKQSGKPKNIVRGYPKISLVLIWFTIVGGLGVINFCNYKPPCKSHSKNP
tara:strand:+ start:13 stop:258 length:246 start_codon:yes stop_codon:yes gene_type:complete